MSDRGEVDPDLVGAAGMDLDPQEGFAGEAVGDPVFGERGAAVTGAAGHAGTVDGVALDGLVYRPVFKADGAFDECCIKFLHFAPGKLAGEGAVSPVGTGDQ